MIFLDRVTYRKHRVFGIGFMLPARGNITTLAAASLLLVSSARADTVNISVARDVTLFQDVNGALANGAATHLFAGRTAQADADSRRRALIQFDLTVQIPSTATITSASLTMNASIVASVTGQSLELHRVLADWGEGNSLTIGGAGGEGAGGPPATGDATWIHRFYNTSLWTTPGGDFDPTVSGAISISSTGTYTWPSNSLMIDDVQGWLDDPAANFGWIILGNESTDTTAKALNSRESTSAANRPILTVIYTFVDCNSNAINDPLDIQNATSADCDANSVPDECQTDTDSDGAVDSCDDCPNDPQKRTPGLCGCGVADTDTDNDGTPNCLDGCPNDPLKLDPGLCDCGVTDIDSEDDGTPDCLDGCPNDPLKLTPGACECGTSDTDTDADGTPDCLDEVISPPSCGACGAGSAGILVLMTPILLLRRPRRSRRHLFK
jgi:hypothetical protein